MARVLTALSVVAMLVAGPGVDVRPARGAASVGSPAPVPPSAPPPVRYEIQAARVLLPDGPRAAPPDGPLAFEPDIPPAAVEIAIAGDVNLGGRVGDLISRHGPAYPWDGVRDALLAADIAAVNLECAVSNRGTPVSGKEYTFRGDPSSVRGLADAGVDVASVANNHSADFGRDALLDTIAHLRSAGVAPVGGGVHASEAYAPALARVNGVTIAFVAATRVLPAGFAAGRATPGVASAYDERRLLASVRAARASSDVVVVMVHWGSELSPQPAANQVRLARALVDAGAGVVAGAHPHVLQPVVRYRGAIVAYSLGNFVFSSGSVASTTTMLLRVGVLPDLSLVASRVPLRIVGARPVARPG